jgi:hypothetical protein
MTEREHPRVTLFYNGSAESQRVKQIMEERGENFNAYDIRDLTLAPGSELKAPTIFSPEGIFQGPRQVEVFLNIPPEARVKSR